VDLRACAGTGEKTCVTSLTAPLSLATHCKDERSRHGPPLSISMPSSNSPSIIHCRLCHISTQLHSHRASISVQVSQIFYTYTQRAYCDHQPADCCSEHEFPTLLSQLTSPGPAGFARRCFASACVRSNTMQLRSHLSYVTRVINGFIAQALARFGLSCV